MYLHFQILEFEKLWWAPLADKDTLRALLPLIFQLSERSSIGFLRGQNTGRSVRFSALQAFISGSNIQILQILWLEPGTKNRSKHSVAYSWLGNLIHQTLPKFNEVFWLLGAMRTLWHSHWASVSAQWSAPTKVQFRRGFRIDTWLYPQKFKVVALWRCQKLVIFHHSTNIFSVIAAQDLPRNDIKKNDPWCVKISNNGWDPKKNLWKFHIQIAGKKNRFSCLMAFPEDTGPAAWEAQQWRRKANAPRANCLGDSLGKCLTIQCSTHRWNLEKPLAIHVNSLVPVTRLLFHLVFVKCEVPKAY